MPGRIIYILSEAGIQVEVLLPVTVKLSHSEQRAKPVMEMARIGVTCSDALRGTVGNYVRLAEARILSSVIV